jgi:hypothetical protein
MVNPATRRTAQFFTRSTGLLSEGKGEAKGTGRVINYQAKFPGNQFLVDLVRDSSLLLASLGVQACSE